MPSLQRRSQPAPAPPYNECPSTDIPFPYRQICEVVFAASSAAEKAGYGCYLFGSAAVYLLCPGARAPGDIDLAVYPLARTPTGQPRPLIDAERAKIEIQRHDPLFYRVKAKEPGARYETLTFRVMPFFALLLMKLNGWRDNRMSPKPWLRRKTITDIIDIKALLNVVTRKNGTLTAPQHQWFSAWFVTRGGEHAREFLAENPDLSHLTTELDRWIHLGLINASQSQEIRRKSLKTVRLAREVQNLVQSSFENESDGRDAKKYLARVLAGPVEPQ
ncbi:hypothetical protein PQX77_013077 [Marasmius sp. AFHP31]|nr:hypothetical protein PQX77_013077 [Marasmius sp. AFHP31]